MTNDFFTTAMNGTPAANRSIKHLRLACSVVAWDRAQSASVVLLAVAIIAAMWTTHALWAVGVLLIAVIGTTALWHKAVMRQCAAEWEAQELKMITQMLERLDFRTHRLSWMVGGPECDWPEDKPYENGSYYNKCFSCQADFIGHKSRCWCRKCHLNATANYDAMTPAQKTEHDAKVVAALKQFWTNGERTLPHPPTAMITDH